MSKRDDVLVARSAYSVVREFLYEINDLTVHQQRDINVYDYIQEYTNLARSTIIKILRSEKGQYIVVEKVDCLTSPHCLKNINTYSRRSPFSLKGERLFPLFLHSLVNYPAFRQPAAREFFLVYTDIKVVSFNMKKTLKLSTSSDRPT